MSDEEENGRTGIGLNGQAIPERADNRIAALGWGIMLSLLSIGAVVSSGAGNGWVFFLLVAAAIVFASIANRSWSAFLELSLLPIIVLLVPVSDHSSRCALALASTGTAALFIGTRYRLGTLWALLPVFSGAAAVFAGYAVCDLTRPLPLFFALSMVPGYALSALNRPGRRPFTPRAVDVIVCSFSGNTAHAAETFIAGMESKGAVATRHRFHRRRLFHPELTGDSLVLAFPVIGWKPPWAGCGWLLRDLPGGGGKPAFIVYSAGGGPENAGMVAWLLLTLKGYRVVGRGWAVYPLNIPTFRIGPARMWSLFDRRTPPMTEFAALGSMGHAFAEGKTAGFPFILWPFPLVAAGILLDNPPLDRVIIRNYVWKKRCIRCGLCVRSCPTERLRMEEYPKASGDCCICCGCVNQCPRNAMHLAAFTEYGNQYRPRWPQFLASRSQDAGGGVESADSSAGTAGVKHQGE